MAHIAPEALVLPKRSPQPPGLPAPRWSPKQFQRAWDAAKKAVPKVRSMDLATAAGVLPATLYKWRAGASEPNVNQAFALAKALGVDIEDLME